MAREIVRSVSLRKVARMTGRIPAALLDIVLPPRCGSCGAIVDAPHSLCIECWRRMRFVSAPLCHACGVPFEFDAGPEAMCADCHASAPPYRRARAALVYDDASRPVIIRFKHADRTDLAPLLARLLEDTYSAVRFIAWQNLKALPGYEGLEYNFVGPKPQRSAAMKSVIGDWRSGRTDVPSALPVTADGRLDFERLSDLWKRRDQRPVEIPE